MSEPAIKLPDNLKQEHPDIEWQDIKDFRNLLTHEYFGIDLEIVWKIIQDDLPVLMNAVREIVRAESSENN
jgi:uncharacterized protein with HEPN domain